MKALVALVCLGLAAGCGGRASSGASAASDSTGTITIAGVAYTLTMTCYDGGPDAIAALGTGVEPGTRQPVRALVQAFPGDPYVGLSVSGRVAYEAALDPAFELTVNADTISGDGLHMVTADDVCTAVGDASVRVSCALRRPGPPPGYKP